MLWLRYSSVKSIARSFSTSANKLKQPITLRPYQEEALTACTDALAKGVSRIGVSLPTGSGKTTVFLSLLSRINPPASNPDATRSLVIVNAVELAQQAAAQAKRLFPHWTVELEQGAKNKASGLADLTVATYQTLLNRDRLSKIDPTKLKAIIIDEAHHAAAPSYRRLLSHFHSAIKSPEASEHSAPVTNNTIPIIGVSATFSRHDGLALGSVFEQIVYHNDFIAMIKDNWLSKVRFTTVKADIDLSGVTINSSSGDFNATSLSHVVNTDAVNNLVVRTWLDKAAGRKSTLVFCVSLKHTAQLTQHFRDAGVDAVYIYSGTPMSERQKILAAFRAGEFPVLLNCALLTEGADIPNIDCVMIARPTRSKNVFAQMIGRGMRLSAESGKKDCLIVDFVESNTRVAGVMSSPTLFGLDPSEMVDGASLEDIEALRSSEDTRPSSQGSGPNASIPSPTSVTYTDYDNPFNFFDSASGAPHLTKLSPNAWVGCGAEIYILELLGRGYLRITPGSGSGSCPSASPSASSSTPGKDKDEGGAPLPPKYVAHYVPASLDRASAKEMKISPFMRPRHVMDAEDLEAALRGCDAYAKAKVMGHQHAQGLLRTAFWRTAPATDSQKALLRARWKVPEDVEPGRLDGAEDKRARIDRMSKGEAANILTRLRHGAQARHEKRMKDERKVINKALKEAKRLSKEHVRVGPLPVVS